MKSRLFTALAIGALTIGMLPAGVSAAGLECVVDGSDSCAADTQVTITVTEGTTIVAEALVAVPNAFPGQMATSAPSALAWWSNEQGKTIFADLDSDPFIDVAVADPVRAENNVKDVDEASFAENNVELSTSDESYNGFMEFNTLDRGPDSKAVPVQDVVFSGATIESASTGTFQIRVHVPQATEGNYEAWMTYSVEAYVP